MTRPATLDLPGRRLAYTVDGDDSAPVLVLGSSVGSTSAMWEPQVAALSRTHRVVRYDHRGHGASRPTTPPRSIADLGDDVVALLDHLGVDGADVFGWSMGAAVALRLGTDHPSRIGRLVLASVSYHDGGLHPGLLDGIQDLEPEHLHGSEFHDEYLRTAPDPAGWPSLVAKIKRLDGDLPQWTAEQIRAVTAPTMIVLADSDIIRPEHAVEMFRLLGGGVAGDLTGLPQSRLAILPGTTHTTVPQRAEWLAPMIDEFLDA